MGHCNTSVVLSEGHIILCNGPHTLWCDRKSGNLTAGKELHKDTALEYMDLGNVWGIVGKICFFADGDWKLIVITQASYVGMLPHGGDVYCVDRIGILPLASYFDFSADVIGLKLQESTEQSVSVSSASGYSSGYSSSYPSARASSPTLAAKLVSLALGGGTEKEKPRESSEREKKVEKRLTEALLSMFNDSQSFYFCLDSDLTQSLQRQIDHSDSQKQLPLWKQVDERFFWNKWMIAELMDDKKNDPELSHPWILPLIQGYVEVRKIPILCEDTPDILQPGWSELYMEERERQLAAKRRSFSVELEMKDMATLNNPGVTFPMKKLRRPSSGSGYDSDSDLSCSEEDEPQNFRPVKFTNKLEHKTTEDVPVIKDNKDVPVIKDDEEECVGENYSLQLVSDEAAWGLGNKLLGQSEQVEPLGQPIELSSQPLGQISEPSGHQLTEHSKFSKHNKKLVSQDSKSKFYISLDSSVSSDNNYDQDSRQFPPKSTTPDISSLADSVNFTNCEGDHPPGDIGIVSSHVSGFYTSKEIPEMDGVLIDLFEQEGNRKLEMATNDGVLVGSMRTQGQTILGPYLYPQDLIDVSPMGNPFLESENDENKDKPSWMRHMSVSSEERHPTITLAIISRRSQHRAGTRYRRRGVDVKGHVANYVETELILKCGSHVVSSVILRGSVPVYWSQLSNKYRPTPVIESTPEETQESFKKHFDMELKLFKEMAVVNLVKQIGREKVVGDAFEEHFMLMDNPHLAYIAFDFHNSYKRNQNLAMQRLLEGTNEFIKQFKFCWIDTAQSSGPLCKQEGVFRVNCMDCLDRTNVVESILSREVLQTTLHKLGVLPFDEKLGGTTLTSYQEMWANNGDIISKQYAGTAAMKGDITRYGERRLTGMMKDGYNSAHRYYLNVFRDSYRQVLIDLMQGVNPAEAFASLPRSMQGMEDLDEGGLGVLLPVQPSKNTWSLEKEEAVAQMVEMCQKELFPTEPSGINGWVMMEPPGYSFLGDNKEEDPCVVLQCKDKEQLCIAKFHMEAKKVVCFLRIPMKNIEKIVIGQLGIILRSTKRLHMRIYYSMDNDTASFHLTFTTVNCTSISEDRAVLLSIAEFLATLQPSIFIQEQKISKKKSQPYKGIVYLLTPEKLDSLSFQPPSLSVGERSDKSHDSNYSGENKAVTTQSRQGDEQVEEEKYSSAPNSPKLKSSRHRRQISRSFDDLLSNKEPIKSPQTSPAQELQLQPSIMVTSPIKKDVGMVSLYNQGFDESDDSESEFDIFDDLPLARIGAVNPMMDFIDGKYADLKKSDDEDGKDLNMADSDEGGKFSRLKGKFFQKVKSSKANFLPRSRSRSPQPSSDTFKEGSSPKQWQSPLPVTIAEGLDGDFVGDPQKRTLMKQNTKGSSPSLWRKMRRTSPAGPSGEETDRIEARKNSKSKIIYL